MSPDRKSDADRKSTLYKPDGTISVKKLGMWIVGVSTVVAALVSLVSHVGDWLHTGLGIDDLEKRVQACETTLEEHETTLNPSPPPPDPNRRLNEALPRIVAGIEEGRRDRRDLFEATTRLATIHEYGLTSSRERRAAASARREVAKVAARQERREEEPLDLDDLLRSPEERRALDMLLLDAAPRQAREDQRR